MILGSCKPRHALNYEFKTDYEVTVTAHRWQKCREAPLIPQLTTQSGSLSTLRNVSVANGDTEVANRAPAFNEGPSTTREVAENTAVKANIGAPVVAKDVDRGDTLTYGLRNVPGGSNDAMSFDIDEDTGQLKISEDPGGCSI